MRPQISPASGPYGFDAATTAALVALLTSKADGGQFALTVTATNLRFTGYAQDLPGKPGQLAPMGFPVAAAAIVRPSGPATARLYAWSAVYRQRRQGGQLVADAAQDSIARGMVAQQAIEWFNWVDVRYPVSPTPNPRPDIAGLALDARGRVIGSLLGYAGPKIPGA